MAGIVIIPTYTTVLANLPTVNIITYYLNPNAGAVYSVFINENYQVIQGQYILEGHGVAFINENIVPLLLDIFVDNNGHLIFSGQDENKYSINSNGHIIYTP